VDIALPAFTHPQYFSRQKESGVSAGKSETSSFSRMVLVVIGPSVVVAAFWRFLEGPEA
jgi:hypothetical protein